MHYQSSLNSIYQIQVYVYQIFFLLKWDQFIVCNCLINTWNVNSTNYYHVHTKHQMKNETNWPEYFGMGPQHATVIYMMKKKEGFSTKFIWINQLNNHLFVWRILMAIMYLVIVSMIIYTYKIVSIDS